MNPPSPPQTAPKQAPTKAALQPRATPAPPAAKPPKVPAAPLTPAQQAQKEAQEAEEAAIKAKEQVKIVAINDAWKAELTDEEKAEVLRDAAIANKDSVIDDVIQPCKKRRKPNKNGKPIVTVINCVPGDNKFNTGLSQEAQDAVVKAQEEPRKDEKTKIKIDYGKVADWEGGSFSRGYVPWGPKLVTVDKAIGEKATPHVVSIIVPSTGHNISGVAGQTKSTLTGNSSSGVTIGAGVDFGGKTDKGYRASAKKAAKTSGLLTEAEVDAMVDKLKPYMGLVRLEACKALRKTPLNLTQKEIDLLNYESLMTHKNEKISQYQGITKK